MAVIRRTEEHLVYQNKYLELYDDDVRFPSGADGTYLRSRWCATYSVGVLPVTHDGSFVLIKQYQYACSKSLLQIPKGMGSAEQSPEDAALRELREETGLEAECVTSLGEWFVDPGFIENPTFLFRANNVVQRHSTEHEPTEVIEGIVTVQPQNVVEMIHRGEVQDVITAMVLLRAVSEASM